jgi:hypothetical protein
MTGFARFAFLAAIFGSHEHFKLTALTFIPSKKFEHQMNIRQKIFASFAHKTGQTEFMIACVAVALRLSFETPHR